MALVGYEHSRTVVENMKVDGWLRPPKRPFEGHVKLVGEPPRKKRTTPANLQDLLRWASLQGDRSITCYPLGETSTGRQIKYSELLQLAQKYAFVLRNGIEGLVLGSIVLLHFDDHLDNIIWFWSTLFAGCIPAMSTPFTNNVEERKKHIHHLHTLLDNPVCLTRDHLLHFFGDNHPLNCQSVDRLVRRRRKISTTRTSLMPKAADLAFLIPTSGSTGNAKAVCLRHDQVLASVAGKAAMIDLSPKQSFLSWVGMDHVANLMEIHLEAMFVGAPQVHVQVADILQNPCLFVNLISRHQVSRTFAPNFFLAKLLHALNAQRESDLVDRDCRLGCLRWLGSGGEANVVETCRELSNLLHHKYGAPENVIVPGFGMTETCAGSIYHQRCPSYDIREGHEFTSLGRCIPGIEMRVMTDIEGQDERRRAGTDEVGDLELRGAVVFRGYFNNPVASAEAFTPDGWFKTGDRAFVDSSGYLNLAGRAKEIMVINGVKYSPHELETTLEEAAIKGATPSYFVCFSYRPAASDTEQICVIYLPRYSADDVEARSATADAIIETTMLQTGCRPYVLPLELDHLPKSTLGKLSRAKIRAAFERGDYRTYQELNDRIMSSRRRFRQERPQNEREEMILREFEKTLELPDGELGVTDNVFSVGISSIDLIRVSRGIRTALQMSSDIPLICIMSHPTIRSLTAALDEIELPKPYNPIVTIQPQGRKTPLWLVHPGVGEILVFLNLARHVTDRPVHTLRARGFNPGETYFSSIAEAVTVYHAAIKQQQPTGPYAIAGYSYGAMLAFEISKTLERDGDEMRFLGAFNLPPHIKFRMRQLDWTQCLLHLAFFLDLIPEQRARDISPSLHTTPRTEALTSVISIASPARLQQLSMTSDMLVSWTDLAFALQNMAIDYEPTGSVRGMDVFCAVPLAEVAASREEWMEGHLSRWKDFCRTEMRFHDVEGAHYTMLGAEHVESFAETLKAAMVERGL